MNISFFIRFNRDDRDNVGIWMDIASGNDEQFANLNIAIESLWVFPVNMVILNHTHVNVYQRVWFLWRIDQQKGCESSRKMMQHWWVFNELNSPAMISQCKRVNNLNVVQPATWPFKQHMNWSKTRVPYAESIWRFPKMVVPLDHQFKWVFHGFSMKYTYPHQIPASGFAKPKPRRLQRQKSHGWPTDHELSMDKLIHGFWSHPRYRIDFPIW